MPPVLKRSPLYRRPEEIGRRAVGVVLEFGLKTYGAAAAVSVALSDAETIRGKSYDAVNAVPNLTERYRDAKYLVDHRAQIQSFFDYVHSNAPGPQQLQAATARSLETADRINRTYNEAVKARDALWGIRPNNVLERLPRAKEHLQEAWAAKPDLKAIDNLAGEVQKITPVLRELEDLDIDFPRVYGNFLSVMDNFATDEVAATLGVMAAAFGLAYALGMGAGFWGRRGRPGVVAGMLQRVGAHVFRGWYVRNLEYALGRSVYTAARQRIQSDIVADPHQALDPEALRELEQYFERRLTHKAIAPSRSVRVPTSRT